MLLFLIIFAACFIPFLSKASKSKEETKVLPADINSAELEVEPENYIHKEYTVVQKSDILFNYNKTNDLIAPEKLRSESALLYDCSTNTVLYRKNSEQMRFPASTTKIMTALVAVKYLPSKDYNLVVGNELDLLEPESSLAYLNKGNILTLEDALYALLLPSGNDAAYVIAVNTARYHSGEPNMSEKKAVEYFCGLMNTEAEKIGAYNTHFCDPDGYHNVFHYTTAEDLLRIAISIREYPLIAEIVAVPVRETKIISGESYSWENGNCLVVNDNSFYIPYATGLKTGFTDEAGYCMVATAKEGEHDLIAVTLKSPSLYGRYTDASNLIFSYLHPENIITEPPVTTATDEN